MKLPQGWKTGSVSSLGRLVTGSTPSTADDTNFNGAIPFVTPGDLGGSGLITSAARSLSEQGAARSRRIPKGAALVVCIGSTIGKTGRAGCEVVTNQQINAVIPNPETDGDFVFYEINRIAGQFRRLAGTQAVPILSKSELGDFPVNVPPLREQRKIADILSTWDEALETLDALIAAKDRQKQALMQQLLTGHRRLKGFSQAWKRFRFSELLEPQDRYVDFDDGHTYSLVSIRRRAGGVFFREALQGSEIKTKVMKRVHAGDFLISRMQVVHGALGMVRPQCNGMYASDSYDVLVMKDAKLLHMPFLDWMSRLRSFWHLAYISSHGVHIEKMTFNLSDFMHEKINIPCDIEEQRQIANILDTADQEITLLRTQRAALDQQKRGLMQRLLTGKIRVKP